MKRLNDRLFWHGSTSDYMLFLSLEYFNKPTGERQFPEPWINRRIFPYLCLDWGKCGDLPPDFVPLAILVRRNC